MMERVMIFFVFTRARLTLQLSSKQKAFNYTKETHLTIM